MLNKWPCAFLRYFNLPFINWYTDKLEIGENDLLKRYRYKMTLLLAIHNWILRIVPDWCPGENITYSSSSSSLFSKHSRFGISNTSTWSLHVTLGVLLPEEGAEWHVGVGVCGVVDKSTMLSVDTDGVRVIANSLAIFASNLSDLFFDSFNRSKVSLYKGQESASSSPLKL